MRVDKDTRGGPVAAGRRGLWAAVVTGFLASVCCVGPLVLVVAGIGGAWVADLTVLDPLRPWLIAMTIVLLAFAHWRYWRGRRAEAACACPPRGGHSALWLWLGTVLVAVALAAPYVLPALIAPSIPTTP
ncbi:mercuric transporter MerT family protein [Acidiferrobacter sp.]|uniref:mercuric transporter MerT family protein n=1 Tax=Acidiferrobacter sp. TaxID=1872107 RepID=UPI0026284B5B|nr:mercuric transporter MerT family protein [Acidiferrobacter sp.]